MEHFCAWFAEGAGVGTVRQLCDHRKTLQKVMFRKNTRVDESVFLELFDEKFPVLTRLELDETMAVTGEVVRKVVVNCPVLEYANFSWCSSEIESDSVTVLL